MPPSPSTCGAREAGAAFDVGRWLGRHPDVAAELADFLRDEGVFGELVSPLLAPPDSTRSHPVAAADSTRTAGRERTGGRRPRADRRAGFDDYEILGEMARGGMGVVYRARQRSLNRVVALKMVLGGRPASPGRGGPPVPGGGGGGRAGPPAHRPGVRGRGARRAAVLRHEAGRGRQPGRPRGGVRSGRRPRRSRAWWRRWRGRSTTPTSGASCTAT